MFNQSNFTHSLVQVNLSAGAFRQGVPWGRSKNLRISAFSLPLVWVNLPSGAYRQVVPGRGARTLESCNLHYLKHTSTAPSLILTCTSHKLLNQLTRVVSFGKTDDHLHKQVWIANPKPTLILVCRKAASNRTVTTPGLSMANPTGR